jgi:hypothetical protein
MTGRTCHTLLLLARDARLTVGAFSAKLMGLRARVCFGRGAGALMLACCLLGESRSAIPANAVVSVQEMSVRKSIGMQNGRR